MRKALTAILLLLTPPLFIISTTPLSSLSEHIWHILLFGILGLGMAGYSLRDEIQKTARKKKDWKLFPSFSTIAFSILLLFLSTHAMPCPYMYSDHTAQTVIDHPCCNPSTPCTPEASFPSTIIQIQQLARLIPVYNFTALISLPDNKAPPISS